MHLIVTWRLATDFHYLFVESELNSGVLCSKSGGNLNKLIMFYFFIANIINKLDSKEKQKNHKKNLRLNIANAPFLKSTIKTNFKTRVFFVSLLKILNNKKIAKNLIYILVLLGKTFSVLQLKQYFKNLLPGYLNVCMWVVSLHN